MKSELKKHLSPHFILFEFTRSGAAVDNNIDNTNPSEAEVEAMKALCDNILEPLRRRFGPIVISSGYRCRRLNNVVGGVPSSQHLKGEAADIVIGDKDRAQRMFDFIKRKLDFDQLIMEPIGAETPRWIHVSYTTKRPNRHQVV